MALLKETDFGWQTVEAITATAGEIVYIDTAGTLGVDGGGWYAADVTAVGSGSSCSSGYGIGIYQLE